MRELLERIELTESINVGGLSASLDRIIGNVGKLTKAWNRGFLTRRFLKDDREQLSKMLNMYGDRLKALAKKP